MSDKSAREMQSDRFRDDAADHPDDSIDLRGIIISLRKFKWPIILTTAICTAITALVVASMTPVYRSTVTLLFIVPDKYISRSIGSVALDQIGAKRHINDKTTISAYVYTVV